MNKFAHKSGESAEGAESPLLADAPVTFRAGLARPNGGAARGRLLFVACLLLICGAAAYTGVVPTRSWGQDNFFLLGNGWRVLCGQRPHVDYYSPWGPLTFLIVALGLAVSHDSPNALGYGNAIVGLLVGLWGYWLGRGRLEAAARTLFGLFLALLVTTPYAIGTWPTMSTHAMVYNRYGYALLGLVLVECMLRAEGGEQGVSDFLSGLSTGTAMALALFLKASFFVVALPILGASFLFRRPGRSRLAGLLGGFGVVAFALLAYLRFDLTKIIQDLLMAAGARSHAIAIAIEPVSWTSKLAGAIPLFTILLALLLGGYLPKKQATHWFQEHQLLIWGLLVFVVDVILLSSNMQASGMPLVAAFGILVAGGLETEAPPADSKQPRFAGFRWSAALLLCGALSLPQIGFDLVGLAHGVLEKAHPAKERIHAGFNIPRLAGMVLYDDPPRADGSKYTAMINEGAALILRNCGPEDRVLTMDMANPFPYALGWQPPRGGMAAVAHNYLFTDELRPSEREFFGDATVVLLPKDPALDSRYFEGFYRIYGPALRARYRLAAESEYWWLYRLK